MNASTPSLTNKLIDWAFPITAIVLAFWSAEYWRMKAFEAVFFWFYNLGYLALLTLVAIELFNRRRKPRMVDEGAITFGWSTQLSLLWVLASLGCFAITLLFSRM